MEQANKQNIMPRIKLRKQTILLIAASALVVIAISATLIGYFSVSARQNALANIAKQWLQDHSVKSNDKAIMGVISIEKLAMTAPIIKYETKDDLQDGACFYNGPELNEVGNITICGSRNKSRLLFGGLGKLQAGDTAQITNEKGESVTYKFLEAFTVNPDGRNILGRSFEAEMRELTLFSASNDGKKRYIFKFAEITS